MIRVSSVRGREVLDSRGHPTVEVEVGLSDGATGRAMVPSGASTGAREALELRDGDPARYGGRGVLRATDNVNVVIAREIVGRPALDQGALDQALIDLDGTRDKSNLGANALLGVSLALAHSAAASAGVPLYRYLGRPADPVLPVPMLNILNGGRHADNSVDFQEFMVVPAGFESFREALRAGSEIYHTLSGLLQERGHGTAVGDEGGFAPSLDSNEDALELLTDAVIKARYRPRDQVFLAMDVAASELSASGDGYTLASEGVTRSAEEMIDTYSDWLSRYPIISIEDGLDEEDWRGWEAMTGMLGSRVQLVGDDLYATDSQTIERGIQRRGGNAALIKLNQVGTVTETLKAIDVTQSAGWGVVVSHRSGETEDTTIADLAVATGAGQLKAGAPARGERTAKYNRLLRIEEELGDRAAFAGRGAYERFT